MVELSEERSEITESLGLALKVLLHLQTSFRRSRYGALYGEKEDGEVIGAEPTFSDILEITEFKVSYPTASQSPEKQLASYLKDLRGYRATHGHMATMISDGPRIVLHLQAVFEYIASQRTTWHKHTIQYGRLEEEVIENVESKLVQLADKLKILEGELGNGKLQMEEQLKERLRKRGSTAHSPSVKLNEQIHELTMSDTVSENTTKVLELLKDRLESSERLDETDDARLVAAEQLAKECQEPFESAVRAVVLGHEKFPDCDELQKGFRERMRRIEECLMTRCQQIIEKLKP
ncbi:hypothetical protein L218DRAFT_154733 [Marasmius fiardii PR-910]|nr:hypothetical protein L218DRAFT_154733 [Marasmius fiardii PR-910]